MALSASVVINWRESIILVAFVAYVTASRGKCVIFRLILCSGAGLILSQHRANQAEANIRLTRQCAVTRSEVSVFVQRCRYTGCCSVSQKGTLRISLNLEPLGDMNLYL